MRRFPPRLFSRAAAALASMAGMGLMACSLSLEDPELEARKKLAKPVEPTWELLEGRWLGDSTYTLFDERATGLGNAFILDIYPDSTIRAWDASKLVFPPGKPGQAQEGYPARAAYADGRLRLSGPGGAAPETLGVRMTFLGNWLQLDRASDHRVVHLHKLKPFDSLSRRALLDSGLWLRRAVRTSPDTLLRDSLRRDFDYLDFSGDSLLRESRRSGLGRIESGPFAPAGRRFAWDLPGASRSFHLDLYDADSLRLWPLDEGRADSGYSLYVRRQGLHPLDLDMTPYVGHLRTDTVKTDVSTLDTHFGRYYDLVLDADRGVATLTNMPGMPKYRSWTVDSGVLLLDGDAGLRTRFKVSKPSAGALILRTDASPAFARATTLLQTLIDGTRLSEHPLERFATAPYLRIAIAGGDSAGGDTLDYFFRPSYRKLGREEFELARIDTADTLWGIWRLDAAETFASGQAGFLFAFQGRTASLGRFTCRSDTSLDMTIRSLPGPDPALARGLVQGDCRLLSAEIPPADSILGISGEFRGRRSAGILFSPLWNLP